MANKALVCKVQPQSEYFLSSHTNCGLTFSRFLISEGWPLRICRIWSHIKEMMSGSDLEQVKDTQFSYHTSKMETISACKKIRDFTNATTDTQ